METAFKKSLRVDLQLNMREAAKILGITPQSICNYNKGRTPIKPAIVKRLLEMGMPKDVINDPTKEV